MPSIYSIKTIKQKRVKKFSYSISKKTKKTVAQLLTSLFY